MILTGEYRNTWRKPFLSVTLSITNVRRTEMGSNPGLRGEKIRIIIINCVERSSSYRSVHLYCPGYEKGAGIVV
jgi:hypothetical protein